MSLLRCPPLGVCTVALLCFVLEAMSCLKSSYVFVHAATYPLPPIHAILRILGSVVLGRLADVIGREIVLWVVALGCLSSSIAAICYTSAVFPICLFAFFSRPSGTLKALVGDWCYALDTSPIETALFYGLFELAVFVCWWLCSSVADTDEGTWMQMRWMVLGLSVVSVALLLFMSISGFRSKFIDQETTSLNLFSIRPLQRGTVRWILGWVLLVACGAFMFNIVEMQLSDELEAIGGPLCTFIAAALLGIVILLADVLRRRRFILFAGLGAAFFLARVFEFRGLWKGELNLVEVTGNLLLVFDVLSNVLIDTLLASVVSRDELGSIFGITNAVVGLVGEDGPKMAWHAMGPVENLWVLSAMGLTTYVLLVPYAFLAARFATIPGAIRNAIPGCKDDLETVAPHQQIRGSHLKESLLCPCDATMASAGVSSAEVCHDVQYVGSVRSALTGEALSVEVYRNDTVKLLRDRVAAVLGTQSWRVEFLHGGRVVGDDSELPWVRPFTGPFCCALAFLERSFDFEEMKAAMEVACRDQCQATEGDVIEEEFLSMEGDCKVSRDGTVASMNFTYVSRDGAGSCVDRATVVYDLRAGCVLRIQPG